MTKWRNDSIKISFNLLTKWRNGSIKRSLKLLTKWRNGSVKRSLNLLTKGRNGSIKISFSLLTKWRNDSTKKSPHLWIKWRNDSTKRSSSSYFGPKETDERYWLSVAPEAKSLAWLPAYTRTQAYTTQDHENSLISQPDIRGHEAPHHHENSQHSKERNQTKNVTSASKTATVMHWSYAMRKNAANLLTGVYKCKDTYKKPCIRTLPDDRHAIIFISHIALRGWGLCEA